MIDKKKIEEESYEITDGTLVEDKLRRAAFVYGAEWAQEEFVKSLWHDASEEPLVDKPILIEYIADKKKKYTFSSNRPSSWEDYVSKFNWSKYCYIEDILPKQKGSEK